MCKGNDCEVRASVGIRTTRPHRDDLRTQIFWDIAKAPALAEPLCKFHAMETMQALVGTLA